MIGFSHGLSSKHTHARFLSPGLCVCVCGQTVVLHESALLCDTSHAVGFAVVDDNYSGTRPYPLLYLVGASVAPSWLVTHSLD